MDPLEFVRSVNIGGPTPLPTPALQVLDGKRRAAVVAGSIIVFTEALSEQDVEDVTNATLLAQLAANKQANREEDYTEWYRQYVNVLENIGFVIEKFVMTNFMSNSETVHLSQVAVDVLKQEASKEGMEIATLAIQKLGEQPLESPAVKIFDDQSLKLSVGNFQVIVVDKDANGTVTISVGAFYFVANKEDKSFLWATWKKSDIQIYLGTQKVVLNESVYSRVRQAIKDKVAPYLPKLVADIPL